MTKKQRVYVGDIVETTDQFFPKDRNKTVINLKNKRLKGIVVARRGDYYGVRFGRGHQFTDYLDGLLSHPVGCMLKRDEFRKLDI